jgi:hypothetical protein
LMEELVRRHYRAHSQGALIFALRKVFEAVDQSALVLGEQAAVAAVEEEGGTTADE